MDDLNRISITRYASTIADLFKVPRPKLADEPIEWVKETLTDICKKPFDRLLIFNADCCAQWMYEKNPLALEPILRQTQVTIPFKTVSPAVTPVCFSSIYTGALPQDHGVMQSVKPRPTLKVDTLIDSFISAGKKIALFTVDTVTLAMLFRDRLAEGIFDMYCYNSEAEVVQRAQEMMLQDRYDVILIYAWMFDNRQHRFGPESSEALTALYQYSNEFDMLVNTVKREWKGHNTLVSFVTDHGCHDVEPCEENKFYKGNHGIDESVDLNILHFMGAFSSSISKDK